VKQSCQQKKTPASPGVEVFFDVLLLKWPASTVSRLFLKELSVLLGEILLVVWKLVVRKDRVSRANRDASAAVKALVWVNVQLSGSRIFRFVFGGVNRFAGTNFDAQSVFRAGIYDYMSHGGGPPLSDRSLQSAIALSMTIVTAVMTGAHKSNSPVASPEDEAGVLRIPVGSELAKQYIVLCCVVYDSG
jgi:hypothetical protein